MIIPGRWDLSQKGSHTYAFFPNVSSRQNPVVRGNTLHHTDGHGPRGIQGKIAQAEDSRYSCPLGGPRTPEHILYECTKYNSIRDRLRKRALIEGVAWPPQLDFWMRRGCYKDFVAYMGRTMRLRLEEEPLHR